ncbi:MAG: DUF1080 domain-containing protein [Verrucomicrobia bacterium]|nr:DUF1080 domain-containing protein [Verrucomicrobiota bacterium]
MKRHFPFRSFAALMLVAFVSVVASRAQDHAPFVKLDAPAITGRWDWTVTDGDSQYPSWLEVNLSGYRTLVGSYVGQFGSARPVANIDFNAKTGEFRFTLPPQWERTTADIVFEGKFNGDSLRGEGTNVDGQTIQFEAQRAPSLEREGKARWGKKIKIFNGKNLDGWKPRHSNLPNGWVVKDGLLVNAEPGNDILTEQTFTDFKLEAQFRYPEGSNSGIYLRGRHEVQIEDNYGMTIDSHRIGGVYGFLTPRVNAAKQAGEWQTMKITLLGRVVTIELNGEAVIERQIIPGITGGALDSDEGKAGPILVQGDHGPIEFRKLTITPAK